MDKLKMGIEYEKYVYEMINSKYKKCWLWSDVPEGILNDRFYKNSTICDDIGCDIVGQNFDDSLDYIQCKNYSTTGENNTINISDLSGFYNFIAENMFSSSFVYYSGKLSSQITCRNNIIKYINIPSNILSNENNIIPRDYQLEAYNALRNEPVSVLDMPCGMGKTYISYLLSLDYNNTILLTPKISTTEQIIDHYKKYYIRNNISFIEINCQSGRNTHNIILKNKNIIASTYDSADIIINLIDKKISGSILVIFDEFHNLTKSNMYNCNNDICKLQKLNTNKLYMSATPKYYKDIQYGKIFKINWDDAIKKKYICEYSFNIPDIKYINISVKKLYFNEDFELDVLSINKAYFILKGLMNTKSKKCIIYLTKIEDCNVFKKYMTIVNVKFKLELKEYIVTCDTSKTSRIKILKDFSMNDNKINIIYNVHVLDEGIDIIKCDSVYITNPNDNTINLIQRMSRCNRKDTSNENKIGNVFIWTDKKCDIEVLLRNEFEVNSMHNDILFSNKMIDSPNIPLANENKISLESNINGNESNINENICGNCGVEFFRNTSLTKHRNFCTHEKKYTAKNLISQLQDEINLLKMQMKYQEEEAEIIIDSIKLKLNLKSTESEIYKIYITEKLSQLQ